MTLSVRPSAACLLALLLGTVGSVPAQPLAERPLEVLALEDLSAFRPAGDGWRVAGDAWTLWDSATLEVQPGTGVLVRPSGGDAGNHLATDWNHGDLELELDFLLAADAGFGIVLQGRYEVQLADSWGVERPRHRDAGGIARRYDPARPPGERAFEGHPPRANASLAPGLWQHLRIVFQAPRFDEAGRKTSNARIVEVVFNGITVQQNVEVTGPTRDAPHAGEGPTGPLVLQSDRGAGAFRDIRYRHYEEAERIALADVRYAFYEGEFSSLSDLDQAEPARIGETFGYVWDLFGQRADRFGAAWEGVIQVPVPGEYRFELGLNWIDEIPYDEDAVPGQSRLTIGGKEVVLHTGAEHAASGRVFLEEGDHPFTLAYFKNRRLWRPIVFFRAEGPGMPPQLLNAPRTMPRPESSAPPVAVGPLREPYVLRSFVELEETKEVDAVSVGEPSGVHYTLDLDDGGLLYVWKGAFADVGSMWHSRGQRQVAVPLGYQVPLSGGPTLAFLEGATSPRPASLDAAGYRFEGYRLDEERRPTFRYALRGVDVRDHLRPEQDGRILTRRLDLSSDAAADNLWLRLAEGASVQERRAGVYAVDGRYFIRIDEARAADALLRTNDGRRELLLPVPFDAGRAGVTYSIIW